MKIMYLINEFNIGGSENGLLHLIDNDFFLDSELTIVTLFQGNQILKEKIDKSKVSGGFINLVQQEKMSVFKLIPAFIKLVKTINHIKPDMIICSLVQSSILGAIATKITHKKCKIITFEHNTIYSKKYYYWLIRMISYLVDGVLYDAEQTKNAIQKICYPQKNIPWFYTPLVSVPCNTKKHSYSENSPFVILSASRLSPQKNIVSSIHAVYLLKEQGYNIIFKIIGGGAIENELRDLIKVLNLEDTVHLLGYINGWQPHCYDADIFLQASKFEGLCIGVIEAMATGIPVVSTDVGGMKNYGRDNENMFKITGTTPQDIALRIKDIIHNPELRQKIGEQGQKDIQALFSSDVVKQKLNDVRKSLKRI